MIFNKQGGGMKTTEVIGTCGGEMSSIQLHKHTIRTLKHLHQLTLLPRWMLAERAVRELAERIVPKNSKEPTIPQE